ncbi:39S ribosomal protein L54, mitochondrial [Plectropomus leopardus]|uniref:39S ribosomal protein L54, mitochondrial n=1 Tax=Plectropomus leopardus TaxID=160734 RepID=UPI001C4C8C69|nr:39S ribosomal protein L54, mitochondrial [Plectropomus leopardus]
MSGYSLFRIVTFTKCITSNVTTSLCRTNVLNKIQSCGYAKKPVAKGKGKTMVKEELKGPEVCKDPVRLTSYAVGVNIFKEGEDPQLKPPEQYPEWLFQVNLGAPKKLQEMEQDDWKYWRRLRKENIWRSNRLQKGRKF